MKNLMFLIRKQTLFKNSAVKKVTRCMLRFLVVNSNFKSLNLRKKRIAICIKIWGNPDQLRIFQRLKNKLLKHSNGLLVHHFLKNKYSRNQLFVKAKKWIRNLFKITDQICSKKMFLCQLKSIRKELEIIPFKIHLNHKFKLFETFPKS